MRDGRGGCGSSWRQTSTLLNLLEEPEPEPESEPTARTNEHGIGGLPTKKMCNVPRDVEKAPRSKEDVS